MVRNRTTFDSARAKEARAKSPAKGAQNNMPGLNLAVREVRGAQILQAKLAGMTTKDAGALVGLSERQSQKELVWLRESGKLREYEAEVANLAPKAIRVAEAALDEGDKRVALKVLELLLRLGERAEARSSKEGDRAASLDDYIARLQVKAAYEAAKAGAAGPTPGLAESANEPASEPANDPYAPERDRLADHGTPPPLDDGPEHECFGDDGP